MFKFNAICEECLMPYKIVWNCKKHVADKKWIFLCDNCIRVTKILNRNKFKSQFQNVTALIRCSLKPSKLNLKIHISS